MRAVALVGLILVIAGIVSLAYGGFTYKEKETVVQLGPVEITAEEKRRFPISPLAGGVMVIGGLILVALGWNGRSPRLA